MKIWLAFLGLSSLLLSHETYANMRCNGHLISSGDPVLRLEQLCGAAAHTELRPIQVLASDGSTLIQETVELRIYQQAGSFDRLVKIQRGRIQSIVSLDKPSPADPACTTPRRGYSTGQVILACGHPSSSSRWTEIPKPRPKRTRHKQKNHKKAKTSRPPRYQPPKAPSKPRPVIQMEEWVYDPGPGRFLKILRFKDGRLISVSNGPRSTAR